MARELVCEAFMLVVWVPLRDLDSGISPLLWELVLLDNCFLLKCVCPATIGSVRAGPGRSQPGAGELGGTGAAPAFGHLPRDRDGLRLGQDTGLKVDPALWDPWLGMESSPDGCGVAGAGTDSPGGLKWSPGL